MTKRLMLIVMLVFMLIACGEDDKTDEKEEPNETPGLNATHAGQIVEIDKLGRGEIDKIAVSPDGTTLAVGGSLGIWLIDSETLEPLKLLEGHNDIVWGVAFSPLIMATASTTPVPKRCSGR